MAGVLVHKQCYTIVVNTRKHFSQYVLDYSKGRILSGPVGSRRDGKRGKYEAIPVEQECENSSVSSTEQAGMIISRTAEGPRGKSEFGVGDGVRTRDIRCHRPTLYQLSYAHQ